MNSYSFFKCYMKMCNLNIMDYVSFRTCVKPLRKVDHLTLDVPFSTTETHYLIIRICRLWNDLQITV